MRPATLTINLDNLIWNYELLRKHCSNADIMAVVKANAYGHGLIPVSKALYQAGCRSFAVTDAEEGAELRPHIAQEANIVLFSGVFDKKDASLCVSHQLTPVITEPKQLSLLKEQSFSGAVWLKADTGMNRLGAENIQQLETEAEKANIRVAGIMSHLACADTPSHPMNQQQIQAFQMIQQQTHAPAYSLLNSAGSIAFHQDIQTDVIRPGIALYGAEPIAEQPLGLKPVAELSSQVMQVRDVKQGETVSYAASWVAPKDMRIAVVALGYADGLPRLLSNQGHAWCNKKLLPIVGRVCMDYCMLAVDDTDIKAGDSVVFLGGESSQPSANHIAAQCQTIAYEIFTGLGARLNRRYIGEES